MPNVSLPDFCTHLPADLTRREQLLLRLTGGLLRRADLLVFSSAWQAQLAERLYGPFKAATAIENPNGPREKSSPSIRKIFLLAGRGIRFKNVDRFRRAFAKAQQLVPDLDLEVGSWPRYQYLEKLKTCYAVAIPSISEVTPNNALDAARYAKPVILTRECAYADRFGKAAIVVDPRSEADMQAAVVRLADESYYRSAAAAAANMPTDRSFTDVAADFMSALRTVCR